MDKESTWLSKIAETFGVFCGIIFPFSEEFKAREKRFLRGIRAGYIRKRFKSFGSNNSICKVHFKGAKNIEIGSNVFIGTGSRIHTYASQSNSEPSIVLGDGVSIGQYCFLTACNKITLGKGVLLGSFVLITDNSHGSSTYTDIQTPPNKRVIVSKGPVTIGDNVWIGEKVTILPNVTIGEGSIIGANTVVTKNCPPRSIVVGNPGRVVKEIK